MATYRLNDQGELRISSQEKSLILTKGAEKSRINFRSILSICSFSWFMENTGYDSRHCFYKDYLIMSQSWGPERSGKLYFLILIKSITFSQ